MTRLTSRSKFMLYYVFSYTFLRLKGLTYFEHFQDFGVNEVKESNETAVYLYWNKTALKGSLTVLIKEPQTIIHAELAPHPTVHSSLLSHRTPV